jgi:DNA segregation ATPase FtsK/SpoIIIE-like protein
MIRTGRSFGIHLIVATQSLGDSVRRSILDNIPLRIALGMTEAQSNSFLAYNNDAAKNLDRGLAIYNDSNGEKDANKLIQVNKVD